MLPIRLTRLSKVPAFPHARQSIRPQHLTSTPIAIRPRSSYPPTLQSRTMSGEPDKKEFLCILPDLAGVHSKRMKVRPDHLIGVQPHVESGAIVAGGAMLNEHPAEGETPSFKGSMMMVKAVNKEAALELLKKDIYTTSGVWDLENAQIIPFKSAVREKLEV